MRFARVLTSAIVVIAIAALVQAHRAGAPPGYTGAPGEQTCAAAGCHDVFPPNSSGNLILAINPRDANQDTFDIRIDVAGQMGGRFGFQITAVDTLGDSLGTWLLTDTAKTQVITGGDGRTYVEQTYTGSKNPLCVSCQDWEFAWLSPPDTNEPAILYVSTVLGDGDSTAGGDYVRTDSLVLYYRSAHCFGVCGDINHSGTVTSADLITLSKAVNYAFILASDVGCSELDDFEGVNLRDEITMVADIFWHTREMDCVTDNPPYVPLPSTDYVVAMNSVVPAGSTIVRIYPEFRATAEYHSFSADFRFDVDGTIPKVLTPPNPDAPPEAGWDSERIEVPDRVDDSIGIIMLTFHDYSGTTGPPATYPLGWFDIRVTPAPYPRKINFTLEGYFPGHPPGYNTPMMVDTQLVGWEITPVYYTVKQTGDVNFDGALTSADIIGLVNYVFKSGGVPYPVPATGDVNCSASVTSADIIQLVNYVFKGGVAPCDVESECTINLDQWTCP